MCVFVSKAGHFFDPGCHHVASTVWEIPMVSGDHVNLNSAAQMLHFCHGILHYTHRSYPQTENWGPNFLCVLKMLRRRTAVVYKRMISSSHRIPCLPESRKLLLSGMYQPEWAAHGLRHPQRAAWCKHLPLSMKTSCRRSAVIEARNASAALDPSSSRPSSCEVEKPAHGRKTR